MTGLWSFLVEHQAEIMSATLEHMELVLIAMAAAIWVFWGKRLLAMYLP